jgi:hypothetical protein
LGHIRKLGWAPWEYGQSLPSKPALAGAYWDTWLSLLKSHVWMSMNVLKGVGQVGSLIFIIKLCIHYPSLLCCHCRLMEWSVFLFLNIFDSRSGAPVQPGGKGHLSFNPRLSRTRTNGGFYFLTYIKTIKILNR